MNNIDHIFRDKLESHEVAASKGSWTKLENSLESKKTPVKFWFFGVAASLLLLMICSPLFKSSNHVDPRTVANTSSVEIPNKSQLTIPEPTISEHGVTITKVELKEELLAEAITQTMSENLTKKREQIVNIRPKTCSFNIYSNPPSINSSIEVSKDKSHSMEITYIASTVKKKEEKSAFGKLWAKAVDIKNGEGDINFRGFKNKFLSTSKTSASSGGR